jgi:starch synthase
MVALEAAERGRAAIVTGVGGLPEIVEDGVTGIVVRPGDVDALAAAMLRLAADPALVRGYGQAARERALTTFAAETAIDGVESVYRDLLGGRAR